MFVRLLVPAGVLAVTLAGAAAAQAGPPHGYKITRSQPIVAAAGTQTRGVLACPRNKVPLGGGVVTFAQSTQVNVASSFPSQNTWVVDVDNAGGTSSFEVVAVCARQPHDYSIVTGATTLVAAGTQNASVVSCPAGSRPLGGGGAVGAFNTTTNLNSSFPVANGWRVDVNNRASGPEFFSAIVVCGTLKGYQVVSGDQFETTPFSVTRGSATCPAPTVPIGGGVFGNADTDTDINETLPIANDWVSFMGNGGPSNGTAAPFAVCAGS
jgi:hypothetical protein